jgi:hypothetical protein
MMPSGFTELHRDIFEVFEDSSYLFYERIKIFVDFIDLLVEHFPLIALLIHEFGALCGILDVSLEFIATLMAVDLAIIGGCLHVALVLLHLTPSTTRHHILGLSMKGSDYI